MIAQKLMLIPLMLFSAACSAGLCESGRRQSPIDITATKRQSLPALMFDYPAPALKIANDGRTVRVRFGPGNQLQIGTERYALQQFHFHTPGGERIAGEEFPMVAHLLHKSRSGQLLAVAVHFRIGAESPLLDTLMPIIPAKADGDHALTGVVMHASALLPLQHGYYRFAGSLTATPC